MNVNEIESALDHAINALSLAKLALAKSSLPDFSPSDESDAIAQRTLAAHDMDSQTTRKPWTIS